MATELQPIEADIYIRCSACIFKRFSVVFIIYTLPLSVLLCSYHISFVGAPVLIFVYIIVGAYLARRRRFWLGWMKISFPVLLHCLVRKARIGGEDIGYSFNRDLKLISEVQAPFRGVRRFFYLAFIAAAGISLFFTVPRLIRAVQGGDAAPDLWETAGNAAINVGGITVLVALFFWDNKKEEEQLAQISRDETLSRLPLRLSTNRVVELVQLRDTVRPVIFAGNKETVSLAIRMAERFQIELLKRGVLLVPLVWGQHQEQQLEKKGFGASTKTSVSLPSIGEEFEKRTQSIVAKSKLKSEVRFKAEVVSPAEWERFSWINIGFVVVFHCVSDKVIISSFPKKVFWILGLANNEIA